MRDRIRINLLYAEIGRGHPFYLDGILEKLEFEYPGRTMTNVHDVRAVSSGISRQLWNAVSAAYHLGSRGGSVGDLYSRLRHRSNPDKIGMVERILARDARSLLNANRCPTIVSHPLLVPMIAEIVPVYYQHGEIAVPIESCVTTAREIFVPLTESKGRFVQQGIDPDRVFVSGLCIEPELVANAESDFKTRLGRLQGEASPVGGFFSSGAEPKEHVRQILLAVNSLQLRNKSAIVFCRNGGRLEKAMDRNKKLMRYSCAAGPVEKLDLLDEGKVLLATFSDRREEYAVTSQLFGYLDYVVCPSHERTNWAVGLGLPMFILHPIIGPFSPLNREFLLREQVAVELAGDNAASDFASNMINLHREGKLATMAKCGFDHHRIDGFNQIARHLMEVLAR